MDNPTTLFLTVLISAIGVGYIVYGRKQRQGVALLCGIILCVYPYFVDSPVWMVLIGAVFAILPFLIRI